MPPVRWKLLAFVFCVFHQTTCDILSETVSMSSDGWRPIIGTSHREISDEITLYKNPTQPDGKSEPVKAQPPPVYTPVPTPVTRPSSSSTASAPSNGKYIPSSKRPQTPKVHPQKSPPAFLIIPAHHGPPIPLSAAGNKGGRRRPVKAKPFTNGKRKPGRGPVIAHSSKHEVYVPAPSAAIGSFSFYNQNPGPKPPGGKHYQPQFAGQFALPPGIPGLSNGNEVIIQQVPVHTFLIQNRNPNDNFFINHNDDFTRNLVPPPYKPYHEKKKPREPLEQSGNINNQQIIVGKPKEGTRHRTAVVPENIIVQLPPPFEQNQFSPSFAPPKHKEPDVEVHVTKEKLKVFQNNVPPHYNFNEESFEQQFGFHNTHKPTEQQKLFTFDSFPSIKTSKPPPPPSRRPTEVYPIFEEPKQTFKKPVSEPPTFPTYDVTEAKPQWGFEPFISTRPTIVTQQSFSAQTPTRIQPVQPQMEFIFLPTPYTPEGSVPTSPTQSEVSSIYAELNQRNRPAEYSTLDPNFFNIKEVSTHFPIVGKPESPVFSIIDNQQNLNEVTAAKEEQQQQQQPAQIYQPLEEPTPTIPPTRPPVRQRPQRRRRPTQRPRTTTTEEPLVVTDPYEVSKIPSSEESYSVETQRPHRRRRPLKPRTTEAPTEEPRSEEVTRASINRQRYRNRYPTRVRPTASAESIEEMPSNHKIAETVSYNGGSVPSAQEGYGTEIINRFKTQSAEEVSNENEIAKPEVNSEVSQIESETDNFLKVLRKEYSDSEEVTRRTRYRTTEKLETFTEAASVEEVVTHSRRRHPIRSTTTTTERPTLTSVLTPENEVDFDYSTPENRFESSKEDTYTRTPEIQRIETTLATTTPSTTTTTTTEAPSSPKSHRIRRPIKYENKNRPRFSVKEYRQRLSQYSSTTTETPRSTSESPRLRFPNRSRKPISYTQEDEPSTERSRFTPKDPRHSSLSHAASETTVTEKKINTRLRPFGRQRSTTEATSTTQRISIKPNIFSSLRRPPPVSLKTRIMGKYNRTTEKTTEKPKEPEVSESNEAVETTTVSQPSSSDSALDDVDENQDNSNEDTESEEMANKELMKNDPFEQSQRVADLTLAAQKDYETPGLFKSVSPNTRIVPSYFTISTDDPILPIEAFFPNLKDKTRNDS